MQIDLIMFTEKLKVNPFGYEPETIAEIINEKYYDKKIVLYGNGKHTSIIQKHLKNKSNVVAIVDDNKGIDLYGLKNLDLKYDFIIPSNHQYAYTMEDKIKSLGLKALNLYSWEFIDFFKIPYIKLKKTEKPILVVIVNYFQPEQISLNAKYLSKEFDIYKIYLTENKNTMFHSKYIKEFYIGISLANLIKFLQTNSETIDKIVLRVSPANYYIFEIVRYYFKKELISSVMDWLLNKENITNKKEQYYINMEDKILQQSDKILHSNNGKVFTQEVLSNYKERSILQYFHYLPENFINFKENTLENKIHLCQIGTILIKKNPDNIDNSIIFEDFNILAKQNFNIHFYITLDRAREFEKFYTKREEYIFHNTIPLDNLIRNISRYHFGLIIDIKDRHKTQPLLKNHIKIVVVTKLFAYLFAGLPVIISSKYETMANFISRYGIGIVVKQKDIPKLNSIIHKCDYQKMKDNIKNNIDKWTVESNYKKLLEFLKL